MNPHDPTHESPFDTGERGIRDVGIFCDAAGCEEERTFDVLATSRDEAFQIAREDLAENHGWKITPEEDLCPTHR